VSGLWTNLRLGITRSARTRRVKARAALSVPGGTVAA
jgi:hypothetical protein